MERISKERFIVAAEQLVEIYKMQQKWIEDTIDYFSNKIYDDLFSSKGALSWALNFLEDMVIGHHDDAWLAYFFCECECDFNKIDIIFNGESVNVKNWGDIYDFLVSF